MADRFDDGCMYGRMRLCAKDRLESEVRNGYLRSFLPKHLQQVGANCYPASTWHWRIARIHTNTGHLELAIVIARAV
jgi:hypothetical protein